MRVPGYVDTGVAAVLGGVLFNALIASDLYALCVGERHYEY